MVGVNGRTLTPEEFSIDWIESSTVPGARKYPRENRRAISQSVIAAIPNPPPRRPRRMPTPRHAKPAAALSSPKPGHVYPARSTQSLPGLRRLDGRLDIAHDFNDSCKAAKEVFSRRVNGYELCDGAAFLGNDHGLAGCINSVHHFEAFRLEFSCCHCLHDHLRMTIVILYTILRYSGRATSTGRVATAGFTRRRTSLVHNFSVSSVRKPFSKSQTAQNR